MIRLSAFCDEAGKDVQTQISALKRNGINLAEIRFLDGKNASEITLREAKEYAKVFADSGIEVWSLGSPIGKTDIKTTKFSDLEKYCRHAFENALAFGTERVRVFSFYNAYDEQNEVVERLSKLVELGKEYGLLLCHENEKDVFGDLASRVKILKKNVHGLGFVFDPSNYIQCGQDIVAAQDELIPSSEYIHVKDCKKEGGVVVPSGEGDGEIARLVSMIKGRDIVCSVEPHLAVFSGFETLENAENKKFVYKSNGEAFDVAVSAFKKIISAQK